MPRPCAVRPAKIMGMAWCGGWLGAVAPARVPVSMKGNKGRSHAGVMSWSLRREEVKSREKKKMAERKVTVK